MQTPVTRISIVESSNHWMQLLTKDIYNEKNLQLVSTYSNGIEAYKGILRNRPDIVIISLDLPQMNGIECMIRILRKAPNIQFLVFTEQVENKYVFAALKGGASGYLLKKEEVEGVIGGLKELIIGGCPMSRSIARKVLSSFRPSGQLIQKISAREREILNLLSKGLLYKEIAHNLNPQINVGTVKQHVHRIYKKLQVNNRMEAVNKYLGHTA